MSSYPLPPQIHQTTLSYRRMALVTADPSDACKVIDTALRDVFSDVEVTAVACPDISGWGLASPGICGDGRIIDIGGVPLMFNPAMQGSVFDIAQILREAGISSGRRLVTGAGGGAMTQAVGNGEWVGNCLLEDGKVSRNESLVSFISSMNEIPQPYVVCPCPQGSCACGCLANVFVSKGEASGPVVHVKVSGRKDGVARPGDWHESELGRVVRLAMGKLSRAPHEVYGLGGVVRVTGPSMIHIMPPYFPLQGATPSPYGLVTMKGWGEVFQETSKTLICLPVLLSSDGGRKDLGLRVEHTHFYSEDRALSGHYHFDMEGGAGYAAEGYFSFASEVIKVDPTTASKL